MNRLSLWSGIVGIAWACVLGGLVAGLYGSAPLTGVLVILGALVGIMLFPAKDARMRVVDWAVLLLAAFEVPSLLVSRYSANSVRTSGAFAISILVYYAVRLTIRAPHAIAAFSTVVGGGGAWLSLSCFPRFVDNARVLHEAGLTDLVAFRSRLIPVPFSWVLGEWLTVPLLALPFACVLPIYLWQSERRWWAVATLPVPIAIAAALCLSLSRGVFWSTVLFACAVPIFMVAYRVITLRAGAVLLASALGVLAVAVARENALYPGTFRAYVGSQTSQVRSAEGRIETWKRSLEQVRAHPLWGVGSSNAALSLLSTSDQEETTGFTSRTFSLPIQVLVEKGIVGFLLYATFLFLVGREFHRGMRSQQPISLRSAGGSNNSKQSAIKAESPTVESNSVRRAMACCFAAGMFAVLARELIYSSLLEHTITLTMFFALAALVCSPETSPTSYE